MTHSPVCVTMSMNKRKKSIELSEVMHKIIAKHGQSHRYKCISRDISVSLSTIRKVSKTFMAHGVVANSTGLSHIKNLIEDCVEGLFEWWRKHFCQLPPDSRCLSDTRYDSFKERELCGTRNP